MRNVYGHENLIERMTITENVGNVGIGTTSPGYKLDVSGTGRFTSPVIVGTPTGDTHAATKSYVDSVGQKFYRHTIDIAGTCNNYYQVVIMGGDQTKERRIKVHRSYGLDPDGHVCYDNDASPGSHVNALLLEIDENQGGWGGQSYRWEIQSLQTAYHSGFADAGHTGHGNDFYVMLLGGYNNGEDPMRYYVDLYEYDSTVEVKYSSAETVSYGVAALDPITVINWSNIYSHWDGADSCRLVAFDVGGASCPSGYYTWDAVASGPSGYMMCCKVSNPI